MDGKTALVTGGAGFIGSHLVDALLAKGYRVICVDNLLTGKKENIKDAQKSQNFVFIDHDVITPVDDVVADRKIDYIFHLASPASPPHYQAHAEETALVNSVGTRNMLQLAKKTGARFLFASTSEVYGDPKEHPQKETYWGNVNPNGIRACYDESKRYGEMMTMIYVRKGLDARIMRIFNTYGPRLDPKDGRVVTNLLLQAIRGEPMTVYGDGTQTRSFCYVSDLVDGIMRLMFTEGLKGQVVNLGNPEEYTVMQLAEKLKGMTGSSSNIIHEPLPEDDPTQRRPDISKAKRLLNWEPVVSVDEGLTKTIAFYKSQA